MTIGNYEKVSHDDSPFGNEAIMDSERELIPLEQQTLNFYGKPIVVVRLPDGRPAVILNVLCDNLQTAFHSLLFILRSIEQ